MSQPVTAPQASSTPQASPAPQATPFASFQVAQAVPPAGSQPAGAPPISAAPNAATPSLPPAQARPQGAPGAELVPGTAPGAPVITPGTADAHGGAHASTGAPAANATFPAFRTETFGPQLFWLAIAFGLLYLALSRVALPRVAGILEARRARLAADLDEATDLRAEAEKAGAAYERSLADAKAGAGAIAAEARAAASAATDARRKALEAELAARVSGAEASIAAARAAAMGNVRAIAVDAAGALVERLGGSARPEALEAAVDAAMTATTSKGSAA